MARVDAEDKATGRTKFTADILLPGTCHVALVRSDVPHADILTIDTGEAAKAPGVVGIYTAHDFPENTFGRGVRDIPIIARGKVRYVGERVAAVVAETRDQAEAAARLVSVQYGPLPEVLDAGSAVLPGSHPLHERPWEYPKAAITEQDGPHLQSHVTSGDHRAVERALAQSEHVVTASYSTVSGHAGYLEPQACQASVDEHGVLHVWATNKTPFRLRDELAHCLGLDRSKIVVHPVPIGGDFGGKGSFGDVPLCAYLAILLGRPTRLVLRYWEDLITSAPRHSGTIQVTIGCDASGRLTALSVDALMDGGAYAGCKPRPHADLGGLAHAGSPYRIPAIWIRSRIAYTNSVPRGHMRAPGSPQVTFAVESAVDELAAAVGIDPIDLRRLNLIANGDVNPQGVVWAEARGIETLEAAITGAPPPATPSGWLHGRGVAMFDHHTPAPSATSMRLMRTGSRYRVEVPVPETGTGSHTLIRNAVADGLGIERRAVEVRHVSTSELPTDRGVGGSRVTSTMGAAISKLLDVWRTQPGTVAEVTLTGEEHGANVTSFCAQVADVAVDPETGEVRVLNLTTGVDVGEVLNPIAHDLQIDGGAVMGYGFARLENLGLDHGYVAHSSLGDFKLPTAADTPPMTTILLTGGIGPGALHAKAVGELSNVPTAAALANAIADATGVRLRALPLSAEAIWEHLQVPQGSVS